MRACQETGCDRPVSSRGWCAMHYQRWQKHRDLSRGIAPFPARFWSKVTKTETCWIWTSTFNHAGYGQFTLDGRTRRAYQLAYIEAFGPIPAGLEVHHVCANRACVNPAHLEAVTHRTNLLHSDGPTAVNARKAVCIRGHALDGLQSSGTRRCRTCLREDQRRYRERQRAMALAE